MPTIEERAHEKLNEVWKERGLKLCHDGRSRKDSSLIEAICRTLETLDAERAAHAQFRQEVSDSVEHYLDQWRNSTPSREVFACQFGSFIIPKPVDPLVDAIREASVSDADSRDAERLRAALAKRGLKLVEVGDAD